MYFCCLYTYVCLCYCLFVCDDLLPICVAFVKPKESPCFALYMYVTIYSYVYVCMHVSMYVLRVYSMHIEREVL